MEEEFEIEEELVVAIAGSELLQSGTHFTKNRKKLSEIIENSILKDGKDGVYDGNATVITKDANRFGDVRSVLLKGRIISGGKNGNFEVFGN